MQGVLFIIYILLLSGFVATLGDRVGYRVGKMRLSWFNLRPRHTAILVTVITGIMISALTLGLLLLLNRSLVDGLFNYSQRVAEYQSELQQLDSSYQLLQAQRQAIGDQLVRSRDELATATEQVTELASQRDTLAQEKETLEAERATLLAEREAEAARLAAVSAELEAARVELDASQAVLSAAQTELDAARAQLTVIQSEAEAAQLQVTQLQRDRDQLEDQLEANQATLTALETQRQDLQLDIAALSTIADRLRQGDVVIAAGEILASGVIDSAQVSPQRAIDTLLSRAEEQARALGAGGDRVVQMPLREVERVLNTVNDVGLWVVRIYSVSNRLEGETVPVIADVTPNRLLFAAGSVIASADIPPRRSEVELQETLFRLLAEANQRSRGAGILADPLTGAVGELPQSELVRTLETLQTQTQTARVDVIAATDIYTAGPLEVELRLQNAPESTATAIYPHFLTQGRR